MKYIIVTTTVENRRSAEELAKNIIKNNLGACVQINEIESVYKWKGEIKNEKEFKIEIKTLSKNYTKLQDFIIQNHTYELPEIISVKIGRGYNKYLNWIKNKK
jgi:periplasmic divalent cation tolerance protein